MSSSRDNTFCGTPLDDFCPEVREAIVMERRSRDLLRLIMGFDETDAEMWARADATIAAFLEHRNDV